MRNTFPSAEYYTLKKEVPCTEDTVLQYEHPVTFLQATLLHSLLSSLRTDCSKYQSLLGVSKMSKEKYIPPPYLPWPCGFYKPFKDNLPSRRTIPIAKKPKPKCHPFLLGKNKIPMSAPGWLHAIKQCLYFTGLASRLHCLTNWGKWIWNFWIHYDVTTRSAFLLKLYHFLPQKNYQRQLPFFFISYVWIFQDKRRSDCFCKKYLPWERNLVFSIAVLFLPSSPLDNDLGALYLVSWYALKNFRIPLVSTTQWRFAQSSQIPLIFFPRLLLGTIAVKKIP